MYLEIDRLRTCTLVRPSGTLGTCGFYPKAWQVAVLSTRKNPIESFLECNPNWTQSDIKGLDS